MGKPNQMLVAMLSLSIPVITVSSAGAPLTRILTLPESVQDKLHETTASIASLEADEEMMCEPSGPCFNCAGSDSLSLKECDATGRKQAFRCFPPDGETESSDGPESGDSLTVYRSCQRTDEDEAFRLLRFQVLCFMGGIASFMQVRKQKAVSASLFDQRKQQAAVELVETQSLVSNSSRDEADEV